MKSWGAGDPVVHQAVVSLEAGVEAHRYIAPLAHIVCLVPLLVPVRADNTVWSGGLARGQAVGIDADVVFPLDEPVRRIQGCPPTAPRTPRLDALQ